MSATVHTVDPYLLTELLRTSHAPVYAGMRAVLDRKGLAVDRTALASFAHDDRGFRAVVVHADGGTYELVTPNGADISSWRKFPARAAGEYGTALTHALALSRGPRQPPPGTPIELLLRGRTDTITLRWTGARYDRRASFWLGDSVFTIHGTIHQGRNDRDFHSSFGPVADIPADVLLDEMPAAPIRLEQDGARFVLQTGSAVPGAIYNSAARASTVIHLRFDPTTRDAAFTETSR